jgi:hypothetical protein
MFFTKQIALRYCVGRLKSHKDSLASMASPNAPGGIVIIVIVVIGEADTGHSCLKLTVL